jgi:peptidoglycan/xylan/chitin deacetylase (PgdA/CDA1 family)
MTAMLVGLGIVVFLVLPSILLLEVLRCVVLEWREDRIPILLYHRLVSSEAVRAGRIPDREPIYAIHDDTFEGQMRFLKERGYTTLSLDEFLAIRQGKRKLPPRPLVVTLDDGYRSNYTLALPILRRYGQKATIFVVLEPDDYTRQQVEGIDSFLTVEQMRELDRSGVAIESHTVTHCVLSEMDEKTARHELVESKRRLSEILDRPVRHLAIPRSGQNRRVLALAREAGYETVCCNNKGSSNGWSNLLALPRIVVERDMTLLDFERALEPRSSLILRLVGNVKRVPAILFGPTNATRLRRALYFGPLGKLFITRRLKQLLAGGFLLYLLGSAAFMWFLVTR